MQQKMMKYMTIFMGLMFYKVASGLVLVLHRVEPVGHRRAEAAAEDQAGGRDRRLECDGIWLAVGNRPSRRRIERQRQVEEAAKVEAKK